jgi:colanic acid biosynthesis glycosyl transferase WcaI
LRILLVVAYFHPEIGSAAHLYFDLAKAFADQDHEVHIVTSYPREFNLQSEMRGSQFSLDESISGINVHRCKHLAVRDNVVVRGIEHFSLPRIYLKRIKGLNLHFDGCIIYLPPLPLYKLGVKLNESKIPSILNIQDFHPQELMDVGVLKNKIAINYLLKEERAAYESARMITVLSEKGVNYVIERGADPSRVRFVYNSVDLNRICIDSISQEAMLKPGDRSKFIITYAGVLSPFQGLDTILDVAKRISNEKDIEFYIVGDGMVRKQLQERIESEEITNVKMLPILPREQYEQILCESQLCLVTLDRRMSAPCLPGKLLNLMAYSKPILAIVPRESETANLVSVSGSGIVVDPLDFDKISDSIMKLKNSEETCDRLGKSGRHFLETHMKAEDRVSFYINLFDIIKTKDGINVKA